MDRISALRNVEEALAAFEDGDLDLAGLERQVRGVLRTYATEFEGDLAAYRASGDERAEGVVVLAPTRSAARDRVRELLDDDVEFAVARLDEAGVDE
jgi:hypothetical protein